PMLHDLGEMLKGRGLAPSEFCEAGRKSLHFVGYEGMAMRPRLCLFPWHRRTGSQVPYESPNESHASYTPDTAWPISRFPPHSSWSSSATPVLMPPKAFRCVIGGSLALISLIHT